MAAAARYFPAGTIFVAVVDPGVGRHSYPIVISSMSFGSQGETAFRAYPEAAKRINIVCVNGEGTVIMPCGRCRQLLWEAGGAALEVLTPQGVLPMDQVLPQPFGPADLLRPGAVDPGT